MRKWVLLIAAELAIATAWIAYHWFFCDACRTPEERALRAEHRRLLDRNIGAH